MSVEDHSFSSCVLYDRLLERIEKHDNLKNLLDIIKSCSSDIHSVIFVLIRVHSLKFKHTKPFNLPYDSYPQNGEQFNGLKTLDIKFDIQKFPEDLVNLIYTYTKLSDLKANIPNVKSFGRSKKKQDLDTTFILKDINMVDLDKQNNMREIFGLDNLEKKWEIVIPPNKVTRLDQIGLSGASEKTYITYRHTKTRINDEQIKYCCNCILQIPITWEPLVFNNCTQTFCSYNCALKFSRTYKHLIKPEIVLSEYRKYMKNQDINFPKYMMLKDSLDSSILNVSGGELEPTEYYEQFGKTQIQEIITSLTI